MISKDEPWSKGTTLLLGLPGVAVSRVERNDDTWSPPDEFAGVCPDGGAVSAALKEDRGDSAARPPVRRGR